MSLVARHLTISGTVQGVFYRGWAVETARRLRLAGWVRNLTTGQVEAVVEGEAAAVERFIRLARCGPPAARVADVAAREVPVAGHDGFGQRATL